MGAADQPGAAYVVHLSPQDVGARVVVRRQLPGGGAGGAGCLGDLLGVLERWDDALVVVRDRHGVAHEVARSDVVAGKRVPPAPARRGVRG